jgi:hypothetical protein
MCAADHPNPHYPDCSLLSRRRGERHWRGIGKYSGHRIDTGRNTSHVDWGHVVDAILIGWTPGLGFVEFWRVSPSRWPENVWHVHQ